MKMLDRKLLRDLWRSKGLLLAIAGILAVGVNNFIGLRSAYLNLENSKRDFYRECRLADFWIDVKKAPTAELDSLRAIPGIADLDARIQFRATVDLPDIEEPINAVLLSLPDERSPMLNDIVMRSGSYFTGRRDDEVIVTDSFARAHRLRPGDSLTLLVNNRRQEMRIVGTAQSAEYVYSVGPGAIVPDARRFGVLFVKRTFAESAFDFRGAVNQIYGRFTSNVGPGSSDVLRRAEAVLEPFGVFMVTPLELQASNQFLTNEIRGIGAIATISPTIFLTVAALVLNVLVTRLVRQQRTVIGTLKALGYSDLRLALHFFKYGIGIGVAAAIFGCFSGYQMSSFLTNMYRQFFEFPALTARVYFPTLAAGFIASVVFSMLGALNGVRNVLKLHPAEAMRSEAPRLAGSVWIERITPLWRRLNSSQRMVLRSVLRNRFRSLTAVFAAAMGVGLLVHSYMLIAAQDFMVDFQFYRVSTSDVDLTFEDERGQAALSELRALPSVDYVEPFLELACTFEHRHARRKASITGLIPGARLTTPRDAASNRIPIPDSGIVINRRLAAILNASIGDIVTVTPVKGNRRPIPMRVARITDSFLGLQAYANLEYVSRMLGEEYTFSGAQLVCDTRPAQLRALYRELKRMPAIQSVQTRRDMIDNLVKVLLESQHVMIVLSVVFAGALLFGSIVNASMVNLAERQREVATLAALGYSRAKIGGLFLRENLLTNSIGILLGLPFGYAVMKMTAMAYDGDLMRLPLVGPPWVWCAAIGLALLFAAAAHAVVQWNVNRLDTLQALNVRE